MLVRQGGRIIDHSFGSIITHIKSPPPRTRDSVTQKALEEARTEG